MWGSQHPRPRSREAPEKPRGEFGKLLPRGRLGCVPCPPRSAGSPLGHSHRIHCVHAAQLKGPREASPRSRETGRCSRWSQQQAKVKPVVKAQPCTHCDLARCLKVRRGPSSAKPRPEGGGGGRGSRRDGGGGGEGREHLPRPRPGSLTRELVLGNQRNSG